MLMIKQHRIYRVDLKNNPNVLYLFGDNLARTGFGGQAAEMRGEPNAHGFATKVSPGHNVEDLVFDGNILHKAVIDAELFSLKKRLDECAWDAVVWPLDGIGTGLAAMQDNAPILLKYLTDQIFNLIAEA